MLDFLSRNWGSVLVALIVLGICGLSVWRLVVQKKRGGCGGCGGCSGCGSCENCGGKKCGGGHRDKSGDCGKHG